MGKNINKGSGFSSKVGMSAARKLTNERARGAEAALNANAKLPEEQTKKKMLALLGLFEHDGSTETFKKTLTIKEGRDAHNKLLKYFGVEIPETLNETVTVNDVTLTPEANGRAVISMPEAKFTELCDHWKQQGVPIRIPRTL